MYIATICLYIQTWNQYEEFYAKRFDELFDDRVPNNLEDGAYMFDTVWTAALALNSTAAKLPSRQSLLDFDYLSANLSEIIYKEALEVKFFGLTVSVLAS